MELTTNMDERLHVQGWSAIDTPLEHQESIWFINPKYQGCLILIDEEWKTIERWSGQIVNRNGINDVQLISKLHPLN